MKRPILSLSVLLAAQLLLAGGLALAGVQRRGSPATPLLAFVPPSHPTRIIGMSAASQPVRNANSGRLGRTAWIMRIMCGMSPDESLIATTRSHSSLSRCTVGTSMGLANIGML